MVNLAGNYLGEIMEWEEIKKKFPSKWVYVIDYVIDEPDIASGRIIGVVSDKDNGKMFKFCKDKGIDYERGRTEYEGWGYSDDGNIKIILK